MKNEKTAVEFGQEDAGAGKLRRFFGAIVSEILFFLLTLLLLFPASATFLFYEGRRIWPAVVLVAVYAVLRFLSRLKPLRNATPVFFSAFALWQIFFARLAGAVSLTVVIAVFLLSCTHFVLRNKHPEARSALISCLLMPVLVSAALFSPKAVLLSLAGAVFLLPLFLLSDPKKIPATMTALFAFFLGWNGVLAGFYLSGDSACRNLPTPLRDISLMTQYAPDGSRILKSGKTHLVETACVPGTYLAATRDSGLYYLDPVTQADTPRKIHEGRVFGIIRDCEKKSAYAVEYRGGHILKIEFDRLEAVEASLLSRFCGPDGLIEVDREIVAVTDICSDFYVLTKDGSLLLRTIPDAGRRVLLHDGETNRFITLDGWFLKLADPLSGKAIHRKFLFSWEMRPALDEKGRRLFVMSFFQGLLFELDADTLKIRKVRLVPLGSRHILYDEKTDALYLSDFLSGAIVKVNPETLQTVWKKEVGPMPRRMSMEHADAGDFLLVGTNCGAVRLPL